MSAEAAVAEILELVRDDHDRPYWRPVATVAERGGLDVNSAGL